MSDDLRGDNRNVPDIQDGQGGDSHARVVRHEQRAEEEHKESGVKNFMEMVQHLVASSTALGQHLADMLPKGITRESSKTDIDLAEAQAREAIEKANAAEAQKVQAAMMAALAIAAAPHETHIAQTFGILGGTHVNPVSLFTPGVTNGLNAPANSGGISSAAAALLT